MDPRIARTRRSLRDALFALARERPLEEISVSDIAERAGVNRSTYYKHYSDKDTLLAEALDAVIDEAVGDADESPISETDGARILLEYLQHVEANASLYRRMLGEAGSAAIQVRMTSRMQSILIESFQQEVPPGLASLPKPVAAAALSGSALATVRAWLEVEPLPPATTASEWIWTVIKNHGTLSC